METAPGKPAHISPQRRENTMAIVEITFIFKNGESSRVTTNTDGAAVAEFIGAMMSLEKTIIASSNKRDFIYVNIADVSFAIVREVK